METGFMDQVCAEMVKAGLTVQQLHSYCEGTAHEEVGPMTTEYSVSVWEDGTVDGRRIRTLRGTRRMVKVHGAEMHVAGSSLDNVEINAQVETVQQFMDVVHAVKQVRQDGTSSAGLYYEPTRRREAAQFPVDVGG